MLDLIITYVINAVAEALQGFVNFFADAFGYDITYFNEVFPFAAATYEIIQSVALALALILAGWQIFKFFWKGQNADTTPVRAGLNALLAVGFIYFGNYILEMIMEFCKYPYTQVQNMDGATWSAPALTDLPTILVSALKDIVAGPATALLLILLILVAFNFVKLLLEVIERYVIAFVLLFLSPLAAASLASSSTSGIYKKFFTMFVSQCILIFLNLWSLKMVISGLSLSNSADVVSPALALLMTVAFLRLACKMDTYVNQLGLNAAVTGAGLGAELVATAMMASRLGKGGNGSGGGSGSGGSVLGGISRTAQTYANRVSPTAAIAKGAKDGIAGGIRSGTEAYRAGARGKELLSAVGDGMKMGAVGSDNGISTLAGKTNAKKNKLRSAANKAAVSAANASNAMHGDAPLPEGTEIIPQTNKLTRVDQLNNELVHGVPMATRPENYNELDEAGKKAADEQFAKDQRTETWQEQANIRTWSRDQSMARLGFQHVNESGASIDSGSSNAGSNPSARIAAVAQGLGAGKHSTEAADIIKAGYGTLDGVQSSKFTMDKSGIHGECDTVDGYRHKMDIKNDQQFYALNVAEREGYEKLPMADGSHYHIRTSKTKMDPPATGSGKPKADARDDAPNSPEDATTTPQEDSPAET